MLSGNQFAETLPRNDIGFGYHGHCAPALDLAMRARGRPLPRGSPGSVMVMRVMAISAPAP